MYSGPIAYQGVAGAYSEEAAWRFAGTQAVLLPCDSFISLFDSVVTGRARWGVVPIANTLAGPVQDCVELMATREVVVAGTTELRISHALISATAMPLTEVKQVWSHPMALLQCRRFLSRHGHIAAVPVYDTAGAVQQLVSGRAAGVAAIASVRCAELYGGTVLQLGLEDQPQNYTRFLLIAKEAADRS